MPPPRFRIRTLMILVAAVAVVTGAIVVPCARRSRFEELARRHYAATGGPVVASLLSEEQIEQSLDQRTGLSRARRRWHREMGNKYYHAFECPWLPVLPDPPMPP